MASICKRYEDEEGFSFFDAIQAAYDAGFEQVKQRARVTVQEYAEATSRDVCQARKDLITLSMKHTDVFLPLQDEVRTLRYENEQLRAKITHTVPAPSDATGEACDRIAVALRNYGECGGFNPLVHRLDAGEAMNALTRLRERMAVLEEESRQLLRERDALQATLTRVGQERDQLKAMLVQVRDEAAWWETEAKRIANGCVDG